MPKRSSTTVAESPRKTKKTITSNPVTPTSTPSPVKATRSAASVKSSPANNEGNGKQTKTKAVVGLVDKKRDLSGLLSMKESFFEKCSSIYNITDGTNPFSPQLIIGFRSIYNKLEDEEAPEKRILVDQFMRDFLLEKVLANREQWNLFLELSIRLAREEISTASLPIALITDLVELSNLQDCEAVFEFVEDRLEVWKEPFFLNSGKNAVLRMCNDLLRRLSRAQNTIFCGRILILLANYFPFSERSGLNIMSEFNADNVTSYKTGDGSDDPEDKMEIAEEKEEKLFEGMDISIPGLDKIVTMTQEEKKNRLKVDYNLYVKFWSLQDFFRNPTQCYNKIAWKTFTMYTQDVLGAFTYFKLEDVPIARRKEREDDSFPALNTIPKLGDEDLYFAKYLTNRRLLELQMGDPSFRRYFMVQLIIILRYLTVSVKFKTESQLLGEEQQDYVRKTLERIYQLMAEIPPDGEEFVKAVQHIMKREDLWNKWKNDGCQPFKKPVVSTVIASDVQNEKDDKLEGEDEKDKRVGNTNTKAVDEISSQLEEAINQKPKKKIRRELGDIIQEATTNNRFLLGNPELTKLWNICPDNLDACRAKGRDFMPPIEAFFAEAIKELDPEPTPPAVIADPSKREIKSKKILGNANFGWRALRLLARRSPYFFQMFSGSPIHPLQNYLEFVLKKIATDLEMPVCKDEIDDSPEKHVESIVKQINVVSNDADADVPLEGDQVMEGGADDDEEMLRPDGKGDSDSGDEEEGEVSEKVRNLTVDEQVALGKSLGDDWKKVAVKLGFTIDEVDFFGQEHKDSAGSWMLKMWTEQEGEDATVADLLYILEGMKIKHKAENIIVN